MVRSHGVSTSTALVVATLAASSAVMAAEPTEAQLNSIRQSCRADYEKVCAAVPPGGAPAIECLKQNVLKVSQPCQMALVAIGSGAAPLPKAADLASVHQKMTSGAMVPATSVPAPAPAATTSTPLTAATASAPSMMTTRPPENGSPSKVPFREEVMIARESCGPEYRQYCPMVRPGGGRAIACLAANDASLNPTCKKVVAEAMERMK
jgi:hypothetical protein